MPWTVHVQSHMGKIETAACLPHEDSLGVAPLRSSPQALVGRRAEGGRLKADARRHLPQALHSTVADKLSSYAPSHAGIRYQVTTCMAMG